MLSEAMLAGRAPGSDIEQVLRALADPTRRAIVERLGAGPRSVSSLAEPLGITLTAVAQHLQVLESTGLAHSEKIGRVRTCRIETAGFSVLQGWITAQRHLWEQRLDRLGDLLAEEEEG